jgi:hypothetical protein
MMPLWISVVLLYTVLQSTIHVAVERWQWRQLREEWALVEGLATVEEEAR